MFYKVISDGLIKTGRKAEADLTVTNWMVGRLFGVADLLYLLWRKWSIGDKMIYLLSTGDIYFSDNFTRQFSHSFS